LTPMKKIIPLIAFVTFCHYATAETLGADTTKHISQDSTIKATDASVTLGANQQTINTRTSGFAITTISDKNTLHNNAGLNISNVLRGQSPNVIMTPSAWGTATTIRGRAPNFVVDGFFYNNPIGSAINVNAFEYDAVSVISNPNASLGYGSGGLGSLIQLKSKTGEDYAKPHLEFNSYNTYGYFRENISVQNESNKKIEKWLFTNALAYSQDFGVIDTRISYAFTTSPAQNVGYNYKTRGHAFRVNTGFHFSDKFNARLILDDNYEKDFYDDIDNDNNGSLHVDGKSTEEALRANLSLEYRPVAWFKLYAQGGVNRIKNLANSSSIVSGDGENASLNSYYLHQQGKFANVFATFMPRLSEKVSLTTFVGLQLEKYKPMTSSTFLRYYNGGAVQSSGNSNWGDADLTSFLTGATLNVDNTFVIDLNYRKEDVGGEDYDSYGATTAFLFGDAFGWTNGDEFTTGKFRISAAKAELLQATRYPFSFSSNTAELPSAGNNFESGIDLGFLNNSIGFSVTAFNQVQDDNYTLVSIPSWGANFYPQYLVNVGKVSTRGWEIMANAAPVNAENFEYQTKVSWGKYKYVAASAENQQYYASFGPDWTMGFVNQFRLKNLYFSFLVDFSHGNDLTTLRGFPDYEVITFGGSLARLRDITLGYNYVNEGLLKFGIHRISISLTGRNLWTIYQEDKDFNSEEVQYNSAYQKTTSLSATIVF
jgi:TonB dependent receptor